TAGAAGLMVVMGSVFLNPPATALQLTPEERQVVNFFEFDSLTYSTYAPFKTQLFAPLATPSAMMSRAQAEREAEDRLNEILHGLQLGFGKVSQADVAEQTFNITRVYWELFIDHNAGMELPGGYKIGEGDRTKLPAILDWK